MKRVVLEKGFRLFEQDNYDCLNEKQMELLEEKYRWAQIQAIHSMQVNNQDAGYEIPHMPMQAADVLALYHVIEDPGVTGSGEESRWISERDWVYLISIGGTQEENDQKDIQITIGGMDAIADVYWNHKRVYESRDVFLPGCFRPDSWKKENWLLIHIHSPWKWMEKYEIPGRYRNKIMPRWSLFRFFGRGYDDYLGLKPYFTRVGVYDSILLETGEGFNKTEVTVRVKEEDLSGEVEIHTVLNAFPSPGARLKYELWGNGEDMVQGDCILDGMECEMKFAVKYPVLWETWQRGRPYLYTLRIFYCVDGEKKDEVQKKIGFRLLQKTGDMEFSMNHKPIKLWGANLAPLDNKTGCYCEERAKTVVRRAVAANMNCIRVWGGGDRLPDSFYEMCDEAGILLWQDFFHDYSMYPEEEAFRSLCRQEVKYQVGRLKHHPCILLWCGSNESIMCRDFSDPGEECIGYCIYNEDYREICHELDPDRYYHLSSPSGGNYANDPLEGDTHSYTSNWFVPGGKYPVFLSENMRSFPPVFYSMQKMISEQQLWPKGFTGQMTKGNVFPWPESWRRFTSADGWRKISEVEQFYDADDLPSMLYRFGASVGKYMTECVGRYRRGRSYEERKESFRRCKGHLWWKMNTSAPHIYSGLLDYYMEPYIPYYALKRMYQPFQIIFSKDDFLGVWAVNDSPHPVEGNVYISLFNIRKNRTSDFMETSFRVEPDESLFLTDLNQFGQFLMSDHVLCARAVDAFGRVLTEVIDYVDIERHMEFPDCRLNLFWEEELLCVETDHFARCVELLAENNGDYFGWEFEDNYFDLLPGQVKKVRVTGTHVAGTVHAKGYYAVEETVIPYKETADNGNDQQTNGHIAVCGQEGV